MDKEAKKILQKNDFFAGIDPELYIDQVTNNVIDEERENEITLWIDHNDRDHILVNDLKEYFNELIDIKKENLKLHNIQRIIMFHLWHDYQLNCLRYTLFSKDEKRLKSFYDNINLCFFSTMDPILQSFLDKRKGGEFRINEHGERYFHKYSLNPDDYEGLPPRKIYEKEIVSE
jgi:hypothetical protein